ncbi:MAG TPA: L,D-transpeptidase family protein, partial [Paracoccaceae bacterium]|nr:L,D-transpeptidase family protein [Paracoccaceae bacterium]
MRNFALTAYFRRLAGAGAILCAALLISDVTAAAPVLEAHPEMTPETHEARPVSPDFLPPPFDRVPTKGKAIFVNVPSFELIAFEDGREVLRSRTVVGTKKYPTPNLTAETSVVRFRPSWKPTPSMIRDKGTSPHTRPPGPNNPLGLLAIRLDPGMLIYLHGTNEPQLFDRENRALSHGCIRVEKWDEVAAFV